MITTAVVSAAGRGTRMKELTVDRPKHLLEVAGRPFISYLLDNLVAAGIETIILVVGHRKDRFEEFLAKHQYPILVAEQKGNRYGTAVPLKVAQSLLAQKQFLSVAGDHYYQVTDLQAMMIEDDYQYVGAAFVKNPREYGCIKLKQGDFLESIIEKPEEPPTNLVNTSLYKFTGEIFPAIKALKPSPRGEYEITDALNRLARQNKVKVVELKKYYPDFGRPGDIKRMERLLKPKKRLSSRRGKSMRP